MASEVTVSRAGPATLAFVEGLHEALAELAAGAPDIPEDDLALFTLAVIEIATNIAVHSPRGDETVSLVVELSAGDELRATLRDSAAPVQLDLGARTMVDALAEAGRGLAIAAAACDELSVERSGGNVWRLVRRLGPDVRR
ncbi:ATP-binding protein [Microbacterium sp. SORGH_AS_0888]|uniref:ATP-binding protein n=1 Tax=Microbacterium sp. SORGH_AS_0888 TaxID=3041791 RepID=UPI00277E3B76|nr:ATP-binding protein [Microbacterium sp. SORGH_AS_0888]MDQ1130713.1 serine/threonine-protein kinase RsbW [Microbacterium sp. SORGH_AS_0888]